MNQFVLAFKSFFALLFHGALPDDVIQALGLSVKPEPAPKPKPVPVVKAEDGALQLLGILQRNARMLDFFLEDVSQYSDDQVGSAARGVHTSVRESLERYFAFAPVIDGVEGTFTSPPSKDPALVKFIGNVPAASPSGGVLRHRGWKVTSANFAALPTGQNLNILAPAELEVE